MYDGRALHAFHQCIFVVRVTCLTSIACCTNWQRWLKQMRKILFKALFVDPLVRLSVPLSVHTCNCAFACSLARPLAPSVSLWIRLFLSVCLQVRVCRSVVHPCVPFILRLFLCWFLRFFTLLSPIHLTIFQSVQEFVDQCPPCLNCCLCLSPSSCLSFAYQAGWLPGCLAASLLLAVYLAGCLPRGQLSDWASATKTIAGSPYTSGEYNYQNSFRNLVCNVNRIKCLSIRFGNSMFSWKWKNRKVFW